MIVSAIFVLFIFYCSFENLNGVNSSSETPSTPEMIYHREFWNAEDPALIISSTQQTQNKDNHTDKIQTESNLEAVEESYNEEIPKKNLASNISKTVLQLEFIKCFHKEENRHWPLLWSNHKIDFHFWADFCRSFWDNPDDPINKQDCTHKKYKRRNYSRLAVTFSKFVKEPEIKLDLVKCYCKKRSETKFKFFYMVPCSDNMYFKIKLKKNHKNKLRVAGLYNNIPIRTNLVTKLKPNVIGVKTLDTRVS